MYVNQHHKLLTRIIYDCSPLFDITIFHIKMSPSLPLPMIMIFISCLPIEVHAYIVNLEKLKSAKFDFSNWILGYTYVIKGFKVKLKLLPIIAKCIMHQGLMIGN